ncbi:MAG: hypothetical protein JWQ23_565 [Herminiimonas sp.]|nr:hypothetical protein [Herminiimonas sp.]
MKSVVSLGCTCSSPDPRGISATRRASVPSGISPLGKRSGKLTVDKTTGALALCPNPDSALFPVTERGLSGDARPPANATCGEHEFFERAVKYTIEKEDKARKSGRLSFRNGRQELQKDTAEHLQAAFKRVSDTIKKAFRSKDTSDNVFAAKPSAGFYGLFSASAGTRAVAGALAASHCLPLQSEGDTALAASGVGLPFALGDAIFSCKDAIDLAGGRNSALRMLMKHRVAASRYAMDPCNGSIEDGNAYLEFIKNARKIPRLFKEANEARIRANLGAVRDGPVYVTGAALLNAKSIGLELESISNTAGMLCGAGAAGVSGVIGGSIDMGHGFCEIKGAHQQKEAIRNKGLRVAQWFETDANADPALIAVHGAYQRNLDRLHRQGVRARCFGLSRVIKGVGSASFGLASVGVGAAVLAGAVAASTGGVALAAFAGISAVLAMVYLGGVGVKLYRKWKAEHTSKERQRQAQILIETHTTEELIDMVVGGAEKTVPVLRSAYNEGGTHPGFHRARAKVVNVAANEYLALHLLAVRLANMAGGIGYTNGVHEEGEQTCAFLQAIGMSEMELQAIFLVAQGTAPAYRVEFIKKNIAAAFGINFRTSRTDGHEAKAAPAVFFNACKDLFEDYGITGDTYVTKGDVDGKKHDFPKAAFPQLALRLFQRIDKDKFIDAIKELEAGKKASFEASSAKHDLKMVSEFAQWVGRQKRQDLDYFYSLTLQMQEPLQTVRGMTREKAYLSVYEGFAAGYVQAIADDNVMEFLKKTPPLAYPEILIDSVSAEPARTAIPEWEKTIGALFSTMEPPKIDWPRQTQTLASISAA